MVKPKTIDVLFQSLKTPRETVERSMDQLRDIAARQGELVVSFEESKSRMEQSVFEFNVLESGLVEDDAKGTFVVPSCTEETLLLRLLTLFDDVFGTG